MNKIFSILGKIIISISIVLYLFCLGLFVYALFAEGHLAIWQIMIIVTIFILIPGSIVYAFIRANKNNSQDGFQKEEKMLDEVVNIRKGKIINPKSNLGRWYLGAFIMIFFFPIIARLISRLTISLKAEYHIILFVGCLIIVIFVVGMVYQDKKKRKKN